MNLLSYFLVLGSLTEIFLFLSQGEILIDVFPNQKNVIFFRRRGLGGGTENNVGIYTRILEQKTEFWFLS